MTDRFYPESKKFGFSIIDASGVAPVESLRVVYGELRELGIPVTTCVWSKAPRGDRNSPSYGALDNPAYRDFILELKEAGNEIGWLGCSVDSSSREAVEAALEDYKAIVGEYPRIYLNEGLKRENLYWGGDRVDQPLLKAVIHRTEPVPSGYFQGHVEGSAFWWGDLCQERIRYVLNFGFDEINLLRINPSMPYRDPTRPFVPLWFSAAEAEDCTEFNQLLRPDRQQRLEAENGVCVVVTNLAAQFVRDGRIDRLARKRLVSLLGRGGWFAPASVLLDHLKADHDGDVLPNEEWDRMQWKWARDVVRRKKHQAPVREVQVLTK